MKLKNKISTLISILILIGISGSFKYQTNEFSFTDKYGNVFIIQDKELIPDIIDPEFLKTNLNGTYFTFEPNEDSELTFEYTITSITRIKKFEYQLRVLQKPISNNPGNTLKHLGYSNYRMKLKKTKKGIALEKIEWMYSEM